MLSSEQLLENAARDGSIDIAEWPRVLENVLQRLHDIVHNDFPLPALPLPAPLPPPIDPEVVASTPPRASSEAAHRESDTSLPDADADADADADDSLPPDSSQSSTKENDAPTDIAAHKPPVPKFSDHRPAHSQAQVQAQPAPDAFEVQEAGILPPDLLSSFHSSTRLLEHDFGHSPPYTVQRLAELVLHPRKHYRFLPAYLRALDRIVSVSSPVSDFPLPSGLTSANGAGGVLADGAFFVNGDGSGAHCNGLQEREGLGSDESLGGALLTPIPWLRHNNGMGGSNGEGELRSESTETILGPHGAGSVETVSVTINGVTSTTGAHTSPNTSTPASPTLSEQSDASTGSSTCSLSATDAQLREQGGVTQGELLRQEQEAGVVPVAQSAPRRSLLSSGAVAVGREHEGAMDSAADAADERPEEHPHARGPDIIGMEDMGPQDPKHGVGGQLDMEAAVGRGRSPPAPVQGVGAPGADAAMEDAQSDDAGRPGMDPEDVEKEAERIRDGEVEGKEEDGTGVLADADGMVEGDKQNADEKGEGPGPDAVETTTL